MYKINYSILYNKLKLKEKVFNSKRIKGKMLFKILQCSKTEKINLNGRYF